MTGFLGGLTAFSTYGLVSPAGVKRGAYEDF